MIVKADEPEPGDGIEVGLKLAVAPEGKPAAESAIAELKFPEVVALIVDAPELPAVMVSAVAVEAMAKSADAPPGVAAFKAKSSTTKEVFRLEFSVPTR